MRLTLLGTGNAAGVPLYGCCCSFCQNVRNNPEKKRSPCSALLEVGSQRFLLDAGQTNLAEVYPSGSLDGIFLTHFHPDHVQGLFHLRWGTGQKIHVYTPTDPEGCADLYGHSGILEFISLNVFEPVQFMNLSVIPMTLNHSKPTLGYLFEYRDSKVAYLTDTKGLPERSEKILRDANLEMMVIDCSYRPDCDLPGHNNLRDVLRIVRSVKPQQTILTHIGHDLDVWLKEHSDSLPTEIRVGYDGMLAYPITL